MLRKLYNWVVSLSYSKYSSWVLGAVAFTESSFFPIPPDAMLIPMTATRPEKAWYYAHICVFASVLGGILGYFLGLYLFESVGMWLINLYGLEESVKAFQESYNEWGMLIILTKGLTPIPYKVVTLVSGFSLFPFTEFVIASVIARATRFYMLAWLLKKFGPHIKDFIDRRLGLATIILFVAIIGTFVSIKYLPF